MMLESWRVSHEFRAFIEELLGGFGPFKSSRCRWSERLRRRINFGRIAEYTLYFTVDSDNRAAFEAEGMSPFILSGPRQPRFRTDFSTMPGI
jgi:hypothetical protein